MTRAFRRAALPLIAYYFVTLALPLANGAAQSSAFTTHALIVLIVPPVTIMLGYAAYAVAHALLMHKPPARAASGTVVGRFRPDHRGLRAARRPTHGVVTQ